MKVSDFLRDRLPAYCIYTVFAVILMIFAFAVRLPYEICAAGAVIILFAVISAELWEFLRKRRFYDSLLRDLSELDKKYLIAETVEPPSFFEGRVIYDILRETDKSMCDNVAEYRRETASFREFIELWVHEVKLPVSSLQLMLHNGEDASKMLEQLRRIDGFTDTVLYYVRSENAEKDYLIKETSLKRAIADTVMKFRDDINARDVKLTVDIPDTGVMTDGKWLGYILSQFSANSLKYFSGERSPEIRITAKEFPDRVELYFRDNGIGIPQSDIPHIFDKSFTGENGRTGAKSTGMGLYIVKNLCAKLGHGIEVRSRVNEYTEFIITFAKNDYYKPLSTT